MARPPKPSREPKPGKVWVFRGGKWITVPDPTLDAPPGAGKGAARTTGGKKPIGVGSDYRATPDNAPNAYYSEADFLGRDQGNPNKPLTIGGVGTLTAAGSALSSRGGLWQGGVAPRYVTGDAAVILGQMTGTKDLADLQAQMKAAGFIGPKTDYTPGQWDDTTQRALTKAMGMANKQGVTYLDVINSGVTTASSSGGGSGGSGGGGGGGGSAGPTIDPEQVRQAVDTIGQDVIGSNVDRQTREAITQQVLNESAGSGPYDVESEIRKKIVAAHPGQAQETNYAGALSNFFGMLGAGGTWGQQTAPNPATGAA